MKSKLLLVCAMFVIALTTGCGGSSSGSSGGDSEDGTATKTASAISSVVGNIMTSMGAATSGGGGSSMIVSKSSSLSDCTFYDSAGTVMATSTPDELVNALTNAYSYTCNYDCTVAGTYSVATEGLTEVPVLPNILDGMIMIMTYDDDCVVSNDYCGDLDIDGTSTIRISDISDDPCTMTFNFSSTDFTVDGIPATYDFTMNIEEDVSCDAADLSTLECYEVVSEDSTMIIGGTTYNSAQICSAIDDTDCTALN
ncbi:MAG: hypothetical protein HN337_06485 [Deltaproteobacteria bacterium]|jgi:hypothetical protein|nr:hypothetical protein [Deltaproteobacteria bacterium]